MNNLEIEMQKLTAAVMAALMLAAAPSFAAEVSAEVKDKTQLSMAEFMK